MIKNKRNNLSKGYSTFKKVWWFSEEWFIKPI